MNRWGGRVRPEAIISRAKMLATISKTAQHILAVEGEGDVNFWEKFIDPQNVKILNCHPYGRDGVERIAAAKIDSRFVCVADRDFDAFFGKTTSIQGLYFYDKRDLENTLVSSSSFIKFLQDTVSKQFSVEQCMVIIRSCYRYAEPVTIVRLANEISNHGISFEDFDYKRYYHTFDNTCIPVARVLMASEANKNLGMGSVEHLCGSISIPEDMPRDDVIHGHDFFGVLCHILENQYELTVSPRHVMQKYARGYYSITDFLMTNISKSIPETLVAVSLNLA